MTTNRRLSAPSNALETDCVAGVVGLEPANPSARYLIGIAGQLRLRGRKPGGGDPSCASCDNGWPLRLGSVFEGILVRDPIHDAVSEGDAIDGLGKTPIIDQVGKPCLTQTARQCVVEILD